MGMVVGEFELKYDAFDNSVASGNYNEPILIPYQCKDIHSHKTLLDII